MGHTEHKSVVEWEVGDCVYFVEFDFDDNIVVKTAKVVSVGKQMVRFAPELNYTTRMYHNDPRISKSLIEGLQKIRTREEGSIKNNEQNIASSKVRLAKILAAEQGANG